MKKISIKLDVTSDQIVHMQMLKDMSKKFYKADKTGGLLGKYLVTNFGAEISQAIFDSIPPEGFDDVLDSRDVEDDGSMSLLTTSIEKARAFSEENLRVFPTFHSELPKDEIDRMRTIIESCSYIGFKRGYLEGYADAKQQDDEDRN